ncbi:MAG: RDD family protein [Ferruginibacter sp.]
MSQTDLLVEINAVNVIPADKGVRFLNYIIDIIGYYLLTILLGAILGILAPKFILSLSTDSSTFTLFSYVFAYVIFWLYYAILEGLTKGKTLGKLITKTRAVKLDGSPITWSDALQRALVRIVPFEPFSGLGTSLWHDKWTNTIVIKEMKM